MASFITHIVLADVLFEKHFSDKNKDSFIVGTSFPDIRQLGFIERGETHTQGVPIEDCKKANSFKAGILFHSYVDELRSNFYRDMGMYDHISEEPIRIGSLKILEDELFYEKVTDWKEIVSYFDKICADELSFGMSEEVIQKWHKDLQLYFSQKPNDQMRIDLIAALKKDERMGPIINGIIGEYKKDEFVLNGVEKFYNFFLRN